MSRKPFIAGNWKMNGTVAEAEERIAGLLPRVGDVDFADVAICVPFTAIDAMVNSARGSAVEVYAQNMHQAESGAYTGEVSAPMLTELEVEGVVLGHSERRAYFGETDEALRAKVPVALAAGLKPILCVGETEAEREAGETDDHVRTQVNEALEDVQADEVDRVAIAYEPIWAIGTGRTATPEIAQDTCKVVRTAAGGRLDPERVKVLYGGSVTPDNAAELMAQPDIDGALVGGASLDADGFARIVEAAG